MEEKEDSKERVIKKKEERWERDYKLGWGFKYVEYVG